MSTVWVICGAGSGVGKTRLAQNLCGVLPNSVYAKRGHGRRRADKPPNFFHTYRELSAFLESARCSFEHIVLESNIHARRREGDIIVFVGGIPGRTDVRKDAGMLRANSHIQVCPGASVRSWQRTLRAKLADARLLAAVCDALAQQRRYLTRSGPFVRSKVWLVVNDRRVFGPGLTQLLEGVDQWGTLRDAAKAAKMSYRHAWDLIQTAQRALGNKLVIGRPGGAGGGQSALSAEAKLLLRTFKRVSAEVAAYADRRFAIHFTKEARDE